jgi:hypothetical protein
VQMTPGKAVEVTPSAHASDQPTHRTRKPEASPDSAVTTTPHVNQESFIIPGTATDSDHPLVNPEKTAAARTPEKSARIITGAVSTAGTGSPQVQVQHQEHR